MDENEDDETDDDANEKRFVQPGTRGSREQDSKNRIQIDFSITIATYCANDRNDRSCHHRGDVHFHENRLPDSTLHSTLHACVKNPPKVTRFWESLVVVRKNEKREMRFVF